MLFRSKTWLRGARGKAIKVISHLLKALPEDNNYRVLFIRRDMSEILASQAKMLQRRGETSQTSDDRMLELFETDLWKADYLLKKNARFELLKLDYKAVLEEPLRQAELMAKKLSHQAV